jgi:PIN domain nuclease of toxin-antitoxin system
MSYLLDTHALIWWLQDNKKLGKMARREILRSGSETFISAASVWEISIKQASGRARWKELTADYTAELFAAGFRPLPVTLPHAHAVQDLPLHHSDPFDRILIVQAMCESLTLITADAQMSLYNIRTIDASQ